MKSVDEPGPDGHDPRRDDLPELRRLAASAERLTDPPPPGRVRRLAARRQLRRRTALVAAAAVLVGGGVVAGQIARLPDTTVPPVATRPAVPAPTDSPTGGPTAAPTSPGAPEPTEPDPSSSLDAERALARGNLVRPEDVPWPDDAMTEVTTAVGLGRGTAPFSACVPPDGLRDLGAADALSRSFVYRSLRGAGSGAAPEEGALLYTAVLRFADAAAAKDAAARVRGWGADCAVRLADSDREEWPAGSAAEQAEEQTVRSGGKDVGTYTRISYRAVGGATDAGFFESLGVVRNGDRLAVVVTRTYGPDEPTADGRDVVGDRPDPHPQVPLLRAAAKVLGT